jgi:hypothetical protein
MWSYIVPALIAWAAGIGIFCWLWHRHHTLAKWRDRRDRLWLVE